MEAGYKEIVVSAEAARRFLLHTQGLLASQAGPLWRHSYNGEQGAWEVLRRLECVQVDPVNVLSRNQHLVMAARVAGYQPQMLEHLLAQHSVTDYLCNARCFLPMADLPLLQPCMQKYTQWHTQSADHLGPELDRIYELVRESGPLSSRQISGTKVVGYWDHKPNTKSSTFALEVLWEIGRLTIARRENNERFYDFTERVVPAEVWQRMQAINSDAALAGLLAKYMRAHRLFFPAHFRFGWWRRSVSQKRELLDQLHKAGEVVPVRVEGVKRQYWLLTTDVDMLQHAASWRPEPIATLLPPLDNLLWLRERLTDLFSFDYTWEIYLPATKRKYGCYTLPLLVGDKFAGRIAAHIDRERSLLSVDEFYLEEWFSAMKATERRAVLRRVPEALQVVASVCGAQCIKHPW